MTFSGVASSQAHIKAGKLKALAVGGKTRLALMPYVPTFTESGFPDVPSNAWFGLFNLSPGRLNEIGDELQVQVTRIEDSSSCRRNHREGYELVASTPEEFATFLAATAFAMRGR